MLERLLRYVHGFSAALVLLACAIQARPASAQPPFPFCFVAMPPLSFTVPASGGDIRIHVMVEPPFCGGWRTSVSEPWIHITSGATGSFDGDIFISIPANTGPARSGVVTVIGQNNSRTVPITQLGPADLDDQPVTGDFDGDRRTDFARFRPSTGEWFLQDSRTGATSVVVWGGSAGDRAVPADYDGDGRADLAFFREAEGYWYILGSRDGPTYEHWAAGPDAVLAPADYDGDGRTDVAFFRPLEGFWYVLQSRGRRPRYESWGGSGDIPAPADYDGDGSADVAFFRRSDSFWYIQQSRTRSPLYLSWGAGGSDDIPAPADYDGDGRADVAFARPLDGYWYMLLGTQGPFYLDWRVPPGAAIARGDFDGDGRADVGFFSPSDDFWYLVTELGRATMYVSSSWRF